MSIEMDNDCLHALYEALEECLDEVPLSYVQEQRDSFVAEFFKKIEAQVAQLLSNRQNRKDAKNSQDYDEEDLEQLGETEEQEDEVLHQVSMPIVLACVLGIGFKLKIYSFPHPGAVTRSCISCKRCYRCIEEEPVEEPASRSRQLSLRDGKPCDADHLHDRGIS
jgi:hypothetical protein